MVYHEWIPRDEYLMFKTRWKNVVVKKNKRIKEEEGKEEESGYEELY